MANPKKAAAKKVAAKKVAVKKDQEESFEIRYDVPIVSTRGFLNLVLLEKIDRTVKDWREGGAIAIDSSKRTTVINHLRQKYPQNLWSLVKIPNNEKQVRIYLIKKNYVPPVKKAKNESQSSNERIQ